MIVLRILLGVLKGAIVGGLLGGALWFLETGGDLQNHDPTWSWVRWPLYGTIGLLTGVVSGRPPWAKGAAWVSSILKGIFGFVLGVGLFFLGDWFLRFNLFGRAPTTWYFAFGAALGALYAVFIEVDDSIGKKDDEGKGKGKGKNKGQGNAKTKAITPAEK